MHNRPRWIVNDMVGKIGKISGYAVNIKAGSVANTFELESQCAWSKEKETYSVDFGSADRFSSCTCLSFRKYRVLCKHFFIIIEKGVRQFSDVSPLYRTHPFVILDDEVVTGTQQNMAVPSPRASDFFEIDDAEDTQISEETDITLPVLPSKLSSFKLKKMKVLSNIKILTDKFHSLMNTSESEFLMEEADSTILELLRKVDTNLFKSKIY